MKHTTESIWNLFCCKLQPYIMKWVSDPHVADDIVQDVFLKIHEKIDSLKDDEKVHSWVLQITKNTVFDYLRRRKIKYDDLDELKLDSGSQIDGLKVSGERDLHQEITGALRPVIDSLPQKYRDALVFVEYEGMSQIQLANKLKISPSGAKSRVQRARKMVRDTLMECCHYEFDKYGTIIGVKQAACCCCNDLNSC